MKLYTPLIYSISIYLVISKTNMFDKKRNKEMINEEWEKKEAGEKRKKRRMKESKVYGEKRIIKKVQKNLNLLH